MSTIRVPLIINAGQFINTTLLGQKLIVPPNKITLPIDITIPAELIKFPVSDITVPIIAKIADIPKLVADAFWSPMLKQLDEYYGIVAEEEKKEEVPPVVVTPPAMPYICPFCGMQFATADAVAAHIGLVHPTGV